MMIEEDNTLITTRQLIFLRKYAIFRDVPLLHLRREQASTLIKGELASDPVTVAQLRYLFALGYRAAKRQNPSMPRTWLFAES